MKFPLIIALASSALILFLAAAGCGNAAVGDVPPTNSPSQTLPPTAGIGSTLVPTVTHTQLTFETIAQGFSSGHAVALAPGHEGKTYVITNNNDWESLWNETHSNKDPKPSLPEVDFTQSMVIAVFQGTRTSGGYSTAISTVAESEHSFEIFVTEQSPGPNCAVTMAFTHPYHIVEVTKINKDAIFSIDQEIMSC